MKFGFMFAAGSREVRKLSDARSRLSSQTHTHPHLPVLDVGIDVFPRDPFSNLADLIRNLIPPREATLRDHPTDLTPLHAALSMLSPIAHGNQTGNRAWTAVGGRECSAVLYVSHRRPPSGNLSGTLSGKGVCETPSRSILIDKGGNYISLAFSANPHGPAGDTERETKRMRDRR